MRAEPLFAEVTDAGRCRRLRNVPSESCGHRPSEVGDRPFLVVRHERGTRAHLTAEPRLVLAGVVGVTVEPQRRFIEVVRRHHNPFGILITWTVPLPGRASTCAHSYRSSPCTVAATTSPSTPPISRNRCTLRRSLSFAMNKCDAWSYASGGTHDGRWNPSTTEMRSERPWMSNWLISRPRPMYFGSLT